MKIKLTPAQMEIVIKHNLHTPSNNPAWLEVEDIHQLAAQLEPIYLDVQKWQYSETLAREIFATRSLHAKITKLTQPQPEPEPEKPIEIGSTVYIIGDKTSTYKVLGFNTDGSVCVYGGENAQYRKYRDIHLDRLTTLK